jgi:hypothetical protein
MLPLSRPSFDPVGFVVLALLVFFFGRGILRTWQARIAADRKAQAPPPRAGTSRPDATQAGAPPSGSSDVIDVEVIDVTETRRRDG